VIILYQEILRKFPNLMFDIENTIIVEKNLSNNLFNALLNSNINFLEIIGHNFSSKSINKFTTLKKLLRTKGTIFQIHDIEFFYMGNRSELRIDFIQINENYNEFESKSKNLILNNINEINQSNLYEILAVNKENFRIKKIQNLTFFEKICSNFLNVEENTSLNNFFSWLMKPSNELPVLNNLYYAVYNSRTDLQDVFKKNDLNLDKRIDEWFWQFGIIELGLEALESISQQFKSCHLEFNSKNLKKINFFGFFNKTLGLGISANSYSKILSQKGLKIRDINISNSQSPMALDTLNYRYENFEFSKLNIFSIFGSALTTNIEKFGKRLLQNSYNVGLWYWEVETLPSEYQKSISLVDEIWVSTDYIRNIFQKYTSKPIKVINYPMDEVVNFKFKNKYIVPENYYYFSFDFFSDFNRKNPMQLIELFFEFKSIIKDDSRLILKSINANFFPEFSYKLYKIIEDVPYIDWIDENWTRDKYLYFLKNAKGFISLHKSEGLGLGLLEAMALEVPVLGTGYSGNLQFMNSKNSFLVDYEFESVRGVTTAYSGPEFSESVWAKPDTQSALRQLIELHQNRQICEEKVKFGKNFVLEHFMSEKIDIPILPDL